MPVENVGQGHEVKSHTVYIGLTKGFAPYGKCQVSIKISGALATNPNEMRFSTEQVFEGSILNLHLDRNI